MNTTKICLCCSRPVASDEDYATADEVRAADSMIDAGEFSSGFDYLGDFCTGETCPLGHEREAEASYKADAEMFAAMERGDLRAAG